MCGKPCELAAGNTLAHTLADPFERSHSDLRRATDGTCRLAEWTGASLGHTARADIGASLERVKSAAWR